MSARRPTAPRSGAGHAPAARGVSTRRGRAHTPAPLDTRTRILDAAEALLRRHGVEKLTVVDVARALDMSHANIYRHFASRTALHDALVERWLAQVTEPLAAIAARRAPAAGRLEEWLLTLIAAKRRKVLADPELFEAYHAAAEAARSAVDAYRAESRRYLARIVRDGVAAGEFVVHDLDAALDAIRDATGRFIDAHFIRQTARLTARQYERDAKRVLALVIAGLRAGAL